MSRELEAYQHVEQSINKKFNKTIWRPFITAIKQYQLIQEGDKIAVCISGGKDSFLNAKLLQMLQRHSDVPFELVYLVMDPGYNEYNRQKVEENAALLNLPITTRAFSTPFTPSISTPSPAINPTAGRTVFWKNLRKSRNNTGKQTRRQPLS